MLDWRSLGPEEMEAHFNPRQAVADALDLIAGYTAKAVAARRRIAGEYDLRYGEAPKETFDLHRIAAGADAAPTLIFIHGGFWRALDKSDHSFVAEPFLAAGVNVANLNYDLCPDVDLDTLVAEVRRGIAEIAGNAASLGIDPGNIHLSGHSAGAHLAAMALNHDWGAAGLATAPFRSVALLSGVYEPEVVLRISVNEQVRLGPEMALRNDAVRYPPIHDVPVLIAVGGAETAGWRAQSTVYAETCREAGLGAVTLIDLPGENHFSMLDRSLAADGPVFSRWLAMLGMAA